MPRTLRPVLALAALAACAPPLRPDPFAQYNRRGVYTEPASCSGCPQVTPSGDPGEPLTLPQGQTSVTLGGSVSGTLSRAPRWFAVSAAGAVNEGTIPVTDGSFNFTVPVFCGTTLVKCVFDAASGRTILVNEVVTTNCREADIRVTLTWDDQGQDLELHLLRPGGKLNDQAGGSDCTWTTCIGAGPDWGAPGDATDDPLKDVDNQGAFGPENIFLSKPESGTYAVLVEHWGSGEPSAATVTVFLQGQVALVESVTELQSHWVWDVARIDWGARKATPAKKLTDCTSSWRQTTAGCDLPLP